MNSLKSTEIDEPQPEIGMDKSEATQKTPLDFFRNKFRILAFLAMALGDPVIVTNCTSEEKIEQREISPEDHFREILKILKTNDQNLILPLLSFPQGTDVRSTPEEFLKKWVTITPDQSIASLFPYNLKGFVREGMQVFFQSHEDAVEGDVKDYIFIVDYDSYQNSPKPKPWDAFKKVKYRLRTKGDRLIDFQIDEIMQKWDAENKRLMPRKPSKQTVAGCKTECQNTAVECVSAHGSSFNCLHLDKSVCPKACIRIVDTCFRDCENYGKSDNIYNTRSPYYRYIPSSRKKK